MELFEYDETWQTITKGLKQPNEDATDNIIAFWLNKWVPATCLLEWSVNKICLNNWSKQSFCNLCWSVNKIFLNDWFEQSACNVQWSFKQTAEEVYKYT